MPIPFAAARLLVGLGQGLALYWLYNAMELKSWPATDRVVFAALTASFAYAPIFFILGLGNLRLRTLALWTFVLVLICCGLGGYEAWRVAANPTGLFGFQRSLVLFLALPAVLFILHSLITAGDQENKFVATYPRYVDVAWKFGVQYLLAILFVSIFWGLLWLGAQMFVLIKIEFFSTLFKKTWFYIPVTAMATAYALHVTDVRAGLVQGARTLKLTLLSWLLPVIAAFAVMFVLSLPFTGLEPLWNTRRATGILLSCVAAIVFLINAAYQDGDATRDASFILRVTRAIASVVIAPLTALALYGLMLRVTQYGWTPQRVTAFACVIVAACYAIGYLVALLMSQLKLKQLEITNIITAYVIVAVILAIFTPIADPAKISVADQIHRLNSGQVAADKFDLAFLRFDAGRYGQEALQKLAADKNANTVLAEKAQQALAATSRYALNQKAREAIVLTPGNRAANITVLKPSGRSLPENFLKTDWKSGATGSATCLTMQTKCNAILIDLDGDGKDEIILLGISGTPAAVFQESENGWIFRGQFSNIYCKGVREALSMGQINVVAPTFKEIDVNGQRLQITSHCNAPPPPLGQSAPTK